MLNKQEIDVILNELLDIPDYQMKKLCDTEDRQEAYQTAKFYVMTIRSALKAYFNGEDITIEGDKYFKKRIELDVDYYIQFYNLIRSIWQYFTTEEKLEYQSSSQLLLNIIECDIYKYFLIYFPEWNGNYYQEYSTKKYRKYLKNERDLRKLIDDDYTKWSESKLNKLDSHLKQSKKVFQDELPFNYYHLICFNLAVKNRCDLRVKRHYDFLCSIHQESKKLNYTLSHPEHGVESYTIHNGEKIS